MGVVAIDVETAKFSQGNMAPKIICLSTVSEHGSPHLLVGDGIEHYLRVLLLQAIDKGIVITGHSIAYDFSCVLSTYPNLWNLVFEAYDCNGVTCTAIRENLLDIEAGEFRQHLVEDSTEKHTYDLADVCKRRLLIELQKGEDTWRTNYEKLDGVPRADWPNEAVEYALNDARSTLALYLHQQRRAESRQYKLPTEFEDTRADFGLKLISVRGIMTDAKRVEELRKSTRERMETLAEQLVIDGLAEYKKSKASSGLLFGEAPDEPIEIKKNLSKIRAAVEAKHLNAPRTDKGAIKTDADTLAECDFEPLERLIEFSSLQKMTSTYLDKLGRPPIHASFWALGAVSGRTSCSRPNLQNQPRLPGVRECFVPRDGYVFLTCDFSSQEMRTLAQTCVDILGVSRLAEFFKRDAAFDPHKEFAKQLMERNPAEALDTLRQHAKVANFGYPGGMGSDTFISYAKGWGLKISSQESKDLKNAWLKQWPEMMKYFNHVSNIVGREHSATMTLPRSGFRRANCGFTDACNSYFQTLANHASKRALWKVCLKCFCDDDSFLYGSRPVLYVHDEIVLETPEEVGHEAAVELEQVMVSAMEEWTPDIPAHAVAVLMRRWSKKAKPVFKKGRLVPWEEPQ